MSQRYLYALLDFLEHKAKATVGLLVNPEEQIDEFDAPPDENFRESLKDFGNSVDILKLIRHVKVNIYLTYKVPINKDIEKDISGEYQLKLNDRQCIVEYKLKEHEDESQEDNDKIKSAAHNLFSKERKRVHILQSKFIELINEKCQNADKPLIITALRDEFQERIKPKNEFQKFWGRLKAYRSSIDRLNYLDLNSKVRQLFALSGHVKQDFLEELRKNAHVEVDKTYRITKYVANDGSLALEHNESMKVRAGCIGGGQKKDHKKRGPKMRRLMSRDSVEEEKESEEEDDEAEKEMKRKRVNQNTSPTTSASRRRGRRSLTSHLRAQERQDLLDLLEGSDIKPATVTRENTVEMEDNGMEVERDAENQEATMEEEDEQEEEDEEPAPLRRSTRDIRKRHNSVFLYTRVFKRSKTPNMTPRAKNPEARPVGRPRTRVRTPRMTSAISSRTRSKNGRIATPTPPRHESSDSEQEEKEDPVDPEDPTPPQDPENNMINNADESAVAPEEPMEEAEPGEEEEESTENLMFWSDFGLDDLDFPVDLMEDVKLEEIQDALISQNPPRRSHSEISMIQAAEILAGLSERTALMKQEAEPEQQEPVVEDAPAPPPQPAPQQLQVPIPENTTPETTAPEPRVQTPVVVLSPTEHKPIPVFRSRSDTSIRRQPAREKPPREEPVEPIQYITLDDAPVIKQEPGVEPMEPGFRVPMLPETGGAMRNGHLNLETHKKVVQSALLLIRQLELPTPPTIVQMLNETMDKLNRFETFGLKVPIDDLMNSFNYCIRIAKSLATEATEMTSSISLLEFLVLIQNVIMCMNLSVFSSLELKINQERKNETNKNKRITVDLLLIALGSFFGLIIC